MYKILVTTDGSKQAAKTAEEAAKLAVAMNAEVTVLSVIENVNSLNYSSHVPEDVMAKLKEEQLAFYKNAAETVKKTLEDKGIKATTVIKNGSPVENICELAEVEKHDLIIVGRRRMSKFSGFFLGSVSNKVLQYAKTNVMVVK